MSSIPPTTTVIIEDLDSNTITPTLTSNHVPTPPLSIHPVPTLPPTARNTFRVSWAADSSTQPLPPHLSACSTNPNRTETLQKRIADLESELTEALAHRAAGPT